MSATGPRLAAVRLRARSLAGSDLLTPALSILALVAGLALVGLAIVVAEEVPVLALGGGIIALAAVGILTVALSRRWHDLGPVMVVAFASVVFTEVLLGLGVFTTFGGAALRLQGLVEFAAVLLLAAVIIGVRGAPLLAQRRTLLGSLLTVLLGFAAVSVAVGVAWDNPRFSVAADAYRLALPLIMAFVVAAVIRDDRDVRALLWVLAAGAAGGAVLTLVKQLDALASGETTYALGRPAFLLLSIALAKLVLEPPRGLLARRALNVVILLLLASTFLSNMRTSWFVVIAMFVVVTLAVPAVAVRKLAALAGLATLSALVLAVAVPSIVAPVERVADFALERIETSPTSSSSTGGGRTLDVRVTEVKDSLTDLWEAGPLGMLVGRGAGAHFPTAYDPLVSGSESGINHQIHMTYVAVAYRHGLFGLAVFVTLLTTAVLMAWRGMRAARAARDPRRFVWLVLTIWLVAGCVYMVGAPDLITGDITWGVMLGILIYMHSTRLVGPTRPRQRTSSRR